MTYWVTRLMVGMREVHTATQGHVDVLPVIRRGDINVFSMGVILVRVQVSHRCILENGFQDAFLFFKSVSREKKNLIKDQTNQLTL